MYTVMQKTIRIHFFNRIRIRKSAWQIYLWAGDSQIYVNTERSQKPDPDPVFFLTWTGSANLLGRYIDELTIYRYVYSVKQNIPHLFFLYDYL